MADIVQPKQMVIFVVTWQHGLKKMTSWLRAAKNKTPRWRNRAMEDALDINEEELELPMGITSTQKGGEGEVAYTRKAGKGEVGVGGRDLTRSSP